jgi:hypothetical protein
MELHAHSTTRLHGVVLNAFPKCAVPANIPILKHEGHMKHMVREFLAEWHSVYCTCTETRYYNVSLTEYGSRLRLQREKILAKTLTKELWNTKQALIL